MDDLFEREQRVLERANGHLEAIQSGASCDGEEFAFLAREYAHMLRQLRRMTRFSDRTAVNLNMSKLVLLGKVNIDALTGIYNRRFMEERLEQEITALSRVGGCELSMLMVDVDCFKQYNDTYGHSAGDECLKNIANALKDSIYRKPDFVARYGGEEFVVVLPSTDAAGACTMAHKILENIRLRAIPHEASDVSAWITLSIGVTTAAVCHWHRVDDYIKRADEAMYRSKKNGKNQYTFIPFEE